jgi:hypothetical protein
MKNSDLKISNALGVDFETLPSIVIDKVDVAEKNETLQGDFNSARKNIHSLINTGMDAMEGIVKVATESDSPRAYEVLTNMMKTLSEMNKDLIDIHDKLTDAESKKITIKNTTNNSIYVGSTSELQNLINQERSPIKKMED